MKTNYLTICLALALGLGLTACDKEKAVEKAPVAPVVKEKTAEEMQAETNKDVQYVMTKMQEKHPDTTKVTYSVNKIILDKTSLYEVVTSEGVFYTDKDVNYILVGNLFTGDQSGVTNYSARPELAEQIKAAMAKMEERDPSRPKTLGGFDFFNSLPINSGFNYVYGTGENHVVLFEDPDCPFCQDLHANLEKFAAELNMKVTVFPFVMEGNHPNALNRVRNLFCSTNPTDAWKNWMLTAAAARADGKNDMDTLWASWSPKNAPKNDCPQAIMADTWQAGARQLGFSATPTVVFENGEVVEGNVTKEAFQQMFADVARQKQERAQKAQQTASTGLSPSNAGPLDHLTGGAVISQEDLLKLEETLTNEHKQ